LKWKYEAEIEVEEVEIRGRYSDSPMSVPVTMMGLLRWRFGELNTVTVYRIPGAA
jgi:hypothetical protein